MRLRNPFWWVDLVWETRIAISKFCGYFGLRAWPSGRFACLDVACGPDTELRRRIENLLKFHAGAGASFEKFSAEIVATAQMPETKEKPASVIGRHEFLEQIGEGGFGVVFMAEQEEPVRRKVALKIIKPGMGTREVIGRLQPVLPHEMIEAKG